jgi:hypothetical protein
MKVRLTQTISGTRDGKPWPAAGEEIDLPESEAVAMLQNGTAKAVNTKDADVELRHVPGVDAATEKAIAAATVTRERQARAKRAHEPINLGAAADQQPTEDDNGRRLPEVAAAASAKVEDPAQATQSDEDPKGSTVETSKVAKK